MKRSLPVVYVIMPEDTQPGRAIRDAIEESLWCEPVPTAHAPEDLPEQSGARYPLMRIDRREASAWTLIRYLFALWRWRVRVWRERP